MSYGSKKAFTLIECLVVLGIVLILGFVVNSALSGARAQARHMQCVKNLKELHSLTLILSEEQKPLVVPIASGKPSLSLPIKKPVGGPQIPGTSPDVTPPVEGIVDVRGGELGGNAIISMLSTSSFFEMLTEDAEITKCPSANNKDQALYVPDETTFMNIRNRRCMLPAPGESANEVLYSDPIAAHHGMKNAVLVQGRLVCLASEEPSSYASLKTTTGK